MYRNNLVAELRFSNGNCHVLSCLCSFCSWSQKLETGFFFSAGLYLCVPVSSTSFLPLFIFQFENSFFFSFFSNFVHSFSLAHTKLLWNTKAEGRIAQTNKKKKDGKKEEKVGERKRKKEKWKEKKEVSKTRQSAAAVVTEVWKSERWQNRWATAWAIYLKNMKEKERKKENKKKMGEKKLSRFII